MVSAASSLRVDDDRIDQLEDVLLTADVAKRVVVHGFSEIDGVQRLDDVAALFKHFAALHQHRTLRERSVKIENGKVTNNFQFRNSPFSHRHA